MHDLILEAKKGKNTSFQKSSAQVTPKGSTSSLKTSIFTEDESSLSGPFLLKSKSQKSSMNAEVRN